MDVLKREERLLREQLENGEIDNAEYNRQMRETEGEYAHHAHESAQRAYDEELERW
jgi:hypothetical protein